MIKRTVGERTRSIHRWTNLRLQPIYRIAHQLAELVCLLSIRSPPKRITNMGTEYPEFHTILFVDHLVLTMPEPAISRSRRGMNPTLIVVRRIVATPKTAGAGVMLDASFPMFTRPMATSSERIALSRPFGCLDFSAMVERQGGGEVCWARLCGRFRTLIRRSVHLCVASFVQLDPLNTQLRCI